MTTNGLIKKIVFTVDPVGKYLALAVAFALGVYAQTSGLVQSFIGHFDDWVYISRKTIIIVCSSGFTAIVVGVLCAIIMTRPKIIRYSQIIFQFFNIVLAIPTLAVLAIVMTFVGIGFKPAFIGLFLVTILPIVRNTYQGILEVPDYLVEAARGQGMTDTQILLKIQIPNSLFVIFAGIRTGFALNVGTSPLVTLIAADSLGEFIFTGISLNDFHYLLIGSITVGLLAILVDYVWLQVQYWVIPRGINPLRSL